MLTFCPQAMPAIRKNNNIVTFKNAETGIRETLYLTPESRRKFKDVGKRRRAVIPMPIPPPKPRILSKEESKALVEKHEKRAARQALLYQLLKAEKLLDRLPDPLPPLPRPLIKRIGPRVLSPPPSKPPFCQTKDYKEILEPTLERILPFFNEMRKVETWRKNPQYDPLWRWFVKLENKALELKEDGHTLTAKEWRLLKGACKRLKSVDFLDSMTRVPEICQILLELNIHIP